MASPDLDEFLLSFISLWDVLYGEKVDVLVEFLNYPIDLFPFDWKTKRHLKTLQLVTVNDLILLAPENVKEVRQAIGLVLMLLQRLIKLYEKRAAAFQTSPQFRDPRLFSVSRVIEERVKACPKVLVDPQVVSESS